MEKLRALHYFKFAFVENDLYSKERRIDLTDSGLNLGTSLTYIVCHLVPVMYLSANQQ